MSLLHGALTEQIIGAAFEVYRHLGYGFLEKVYQRAMFVELRLRNLSVSLEPDAEVFFKDVQVGHYAADLLVEGKVLVELKVASELHNADLAQLINELHVLRREVGLLINFGRKGVEFKRAVHSQSSSPSSDSTEIPACSPPPPCDP
jgi:GxxExxY protein